MLYVMSKLKDKNDLNLVAAYWRGFLTPFKNAMRALAKNKVRTFLTVLGIVIGIMAVITVMSAGDGLEAYLVDQVSSFGNNLIQVEIKVPNTSHVSTENMSSFAQGVQVTTMTIDDAEAIKKLPNVRGAYANMIGQELVSYGSANRQIMLWGVGASFIDIDASEVAYGRFFSEAEDKGLAQVVVIGQTVKDKLFGTEEALGKSIKIGKQKFEVIGLMEKRGSITFFDMDNIIYLPVRTLQKKVMGIDHVMAITTEAQDNDIADQTKDEITHLLRERHNLTSGDPDKDDFAVMTMAEAVDLYDTIFGAVNLLLGAIAGISLVVGGVGIMNIMYVSVAERTYEIGLRKAVGATSSNILWQFLWEAIVITFFGAVVGFVIGVGLSFLVAVIATAQGIGWKFVVSPLSVMLAVGVSLTIGLLFGVWPARAASKLEAVDALRH